MVRAPCCEKLGLRRGPWTPEEDHLLVAHINRHGHSNWRALPKQAGLSRCGKSCRLRWMNYLRPDIKRGNFTNEEEDAIFRLHEILGNRWSAIASKLPGRTDNEIKNVWHTYLKKKKKGKATHPPSSNSGKMTPPSSESISSSTPSEFPLPELPSPESSGDFSSDAEEGYRRDSVGVKIKKEEPSYPPLEIEDSFWSEIGSSISEYRMDDGMEFWYNLYLTAGDSPPGVSMLPELL